MGTACSKRRSLGFGGKSRIAPLVWERFGDTTNYVEPFAGSMAVLLARPDAHAWWERIETVNDLDGLLCNFYRAIQQAPEEVARWADFPPNENQLHAVHTWLVGRRESLQERLEGDPEFFDAKAAGWWLYGICLWIGGEWCSGKGPWKIVDGRLVRDSDDGGDGVERKRIHLGNAGQGINRALLHLGDAGRGINRQLLHLGGGRGINRQIDSDPNLCDAMSDHLREMMQQIANRLRRVRVACGDWTRVCGPSPTVNVGTTAVFLDPPYGHAERNPGLYRQEMSCPSAVREWAIEHGDDPRMRIALCGYDSEHEMPDGWTREAWKAHGGYANIGDGRGRDNATRETIWFSPHCLRPAQGSLFDLFDGEDHGGGYPEEVGRADQALQG